MNPWLWLSAAVVLEVAGTSFLKLSHGLTRFWPTILMFFFYGLAFVGLSMAIRQIEACRDARDRLLPSLSIIDSQYATT